MRREYSSRTPDYFDRIDNDLCAKAGQRAVMHVFGYAAPFAATIRLPSWRGLQKFFEARIGSDLEHAVIANDRALRCWNQGPGVKIPGVVEHSFDLIVAVSSDCQEREEELAVQIGIEVDALAQAAQMAFLQGPSCRAEEPREPVARFVA